MVGNPNIAEHGKATQFKTGDDPKRENNGRKPGIKNWSTIVQDLLADEEFIDKALEKKPGWWDQLPGKNAGYAIVAAMAIKAMGGNSHAAQWIRETGYGNKIDLEVKVKPTPILEGMKKRKQVDIDVPENDSPRKDQRPIEAN